MQTQLRAVIAVHPAETYGARARLFAALEAAFPVTFRAFTRREEADAVIAFARDPGAPTPPECLAAGLPALILGEGGDETSDPRLVRIADTDAVDHRVRGIALSERVVGSPPAGDAVEVLAASGTEAIWARSDGIARVRVALPELGPGATLHALLLAHPLAAITLVQFLRERTQRHAFRAPPLRAAFVFDDPNLRSPSYGHIDYPRLLAHADRHGYHAAMAMIPLDASRRPHGPTVELFARRRDRLSLVAHGNDHVKRELLRHRRAEDAVAMAAQAIRRVERFERCWGLRVDRVMTPPHGMCSENVARALAAVGFDALCSIHPVPWTGRPEAAPPLTGWAPAQFVGACPVIPRVLLRASREEIALRAFLDHPIVLYAHHDDLAQGLELLSETTTRVNRLGNVQWTSLGDIALSNYGQRLVAGRLAVQPYARRLRIVSPGDAREITVDEPRQTYGAPALRGWSIDGHTVHRFGATTRVPGDGPIQIRLVGVDDISPHAVSPPAWTPWPRIRRIGTENRDRVQGRQGLRDA